MKKTEGTDPGLVKDSPLRELVRTLVRYYLSSGHLVFISLVSEKKVRALVKLRPATCDLKGKRLAREWKRINRSFVQLTAMLSVTADHKYSTQCMLGDK